MTAQIHNGNAQLSCPPVASVSVVSTNAITLHMMEVIHASHIIQDAPEVGDGEGFILFWPSY
mgnify:CR=1 FL=1